MHFSVMTTEGNSGGAACVFPFLFMEELQYSCLPNANLGFDLWCGTTPDFDRDGAWGVCLLRGIA